MEERTLAERWTPAANKILDAADRLLAAFGYKKMTIDTLANEAGIGKGTVYLSFESKADVALACIDRMAARLLARIETIGAASELPDRRVHDMLVERVMSRFDYARRHFSSIDDLLAAIRPELLRHRQEHFQAEAAALTTVIEKGRAQGSFEVADPAAAAAAMVTATNALLPYSLSTEELGRRPEILRRTEEVIHLLLRGLVAEPRLER
jgi:AcrR family transcriptional regulator